jgi:hypothetical protein
MRKLPLILSVTILVQLGTQAKAGTPDHHPDRTHPRNIHFRSQFRPRPFYFFNGGGWQLYPSYPYTGYTDNGDIIYQGVDLSDTNYPFAQPTSDPNIVVSPFVPNELIGVAGIPPGAKVKDPVSQEIFLRP